MLIYRVPNGPPSFDTYCVLIGPPPAELYFVPVSHWSSFLRIYTAVLLVLTPADTYILCSYWSSFLLIYTIYTVFLLVLPPTFSYNTVLLLVSLSLLYCAPIGRTFSYYTVLLLVSLSPIILLWRPGIRQWNIQEIREIIMYCS